MRHLTLRHLQERNAALREEEDRMARHLLKLTPDHPDYLTLDREFMLVYGRRQEIIESLRMLGASHIDD